VHASKTITKLINRYSLEHCECETDESGTSGRRKEEEQNMLHLLYNAIQMMKSMEYRSSHNIWCMPQKSITELLSGHCTSV